MLSLKPSNLTPGFIPRPEWIVVAPIFTQLLTQLDILF